MSVFGRIILGATGSSVLLGIALAALSRDWVAQANVSTGVVVFLSMFAIWASALYKGKP